MNWYHNNAGAAEGPMDESAMAQLARDKKIAPDSLVWHPGLEAWQTIAALSPSWWAVSLPTSAGSSASVGEKKPTKTKADASERRLAGPKAPTTVAAEKPEGGLLKRLFGFGKKKS